MLFDLSHISYRYAQFAARAGDAFGGIDAYQIFVTAALLLACLALAVRPGKGWRSGPAFCGALLISLFVARLPSFFPILFNPDEASMLAGARKLLHDPVFWRSVDGTTGGPLDFYPLLLVRLLGLPLDYAGGRVLGMLCVWAAIVFLFLTARLVMPEWAARISVLPLQAAVMRFSFSEFLQYSSECVPMTLTGLAVWLLARRYFVEKGTAWEWGALGTTLAALPLAKLQAAPTAAVLGAAALAIVWTRRDRDGRASAAWLLGGCAAIALALLAALAAFGLLHDFNESYLRNNLLYAARPEVAWTPSTFLSGFVFRSPDFGSFLIWVAIFLALALAYCAWRKARRPSAAGIAGAVLLAAAVYQIYRPGRPFWHYLLFLIVPAGMTLIAAFAGVLKRSSRPKLMATVFLGVTVVAPVVAGATGPERISLAWLAELPERPEMPAALRIAELIRPGDLLAIWGWAPELYVRLGAVPATRDPHTQRQIEPGAQREYYRDRFLEDLRADPPRVFAEAVGPSRRAYQNRGSDGFEAVPRLRDYIRANYELTDDVESVRIYVRRGTAAPAAAPLTVPLALNSGGPELVDRAGARWSADSRFYAGAAEEFPKIPELPDLSPVFLTDRICPVTCEYAFPLANGDYRIRLHFIELIHGAPGARVFDVTVNHAPAFRDVDIVREAGGAGRPIVKELQAEVTNGRLTVVLLPKVREAKINGIEVLPVNSR